MDINGLFESWLILERAKGTQKSAITRLNTACGTQYRENWPSKMRANAFSLERTPIAVRRYMMQIVIADLFPDKSKKEQEKLIYSLT